MRTLTGQVVLHLLSNLHTYRILLFLAYQSSDMLGHVLFATAGVSGCGRA